MDLFVVYLKTVPDVATIYSSDSCQTNKFLHKRTYTVSVLKLNLKKEGINSSKKKRLTFTDIRIFKY